LSETPPESQVQEKPIGTGLAAVEPPAFIINLPDDPEASLAESKFKKAVYALAKAFPRIDEARANVKTHARPGSRTRFEVEVFVEIPGHPRFEFVQEGWDLLEVFDRISDKLKELMTKPKEKTSYRNYPPRSEIAVETE
jgi:ribosome-associated translation inhibitor RaiA